MVSTFCSLVVAADLITMPETYGKTVLKGNPIYYANFEEAFYMRDKGLDPYTETPYFKQNYLLFRILYCLKDWKLAIKFLHLFFVVCMGALFGQIIGGNKKYKTIFTAIILVNPITVGPGDPDLLLQGWCLVFLRLHPVAGPDILLAGERQVPDGRSAVRHQRVLQSSGADLHLSSVADVLRSRQPCQTHVLSLRGSGRQRGAGASGSHRPLERQRQRRFC